MSSFLIAATTLALGIALTTALNCHQLRRKLASYLSDSAQQLAELQAEIAVLSTQIRRQDQLSPSSGMPPKGFNLNRRAEAVRRMRAGHQPNQLVSATGWSAAELELLQKVERLHQ